jgi:hypothetical protein
LRLAEPVGFCGDIEDIVILEGVLHRVFANDGG